VERKRDCGQEHRPGRWRTAAEPGQCPVGGDRLGRAVEHDSHYTGSARLRVDPGQHCARYSAGLFVAGLRRRGLGREITRLLLSWAFGVLGAHRVELEVLAGNSRAISCYQACGFRHEGIRREAELYPEGWNDFLLIGVLQAEYQSQPWTARTA
jgi:RimJ/RimL family protein N-acetyltransferase